MNVTPELVFRGNHYRYICCSDALQYSLQNIFKINIKVAAVQYYSMHPA